MSSSSSEMVAAGHWLFEQGCDFVRGVAQIGNLPASDQIEIAFAGRSNVGKSSLINALTRRKNLARTSNTPGRTQELNFFRLVPQQAQGPWLVDMPGYGYARESKDKISAWNHLLTSYLRGRAHLRRVFILIDARHGLKSNDLEMMDDLDRAAVVYQIVLTKADKIKPSAQDSLLAQTATALKRRPAAFPDIIITSSETGLGVELLRAEIATLVDLAAMGYKGARLDNEV